MGGLRQKLPWTHLTMLVGCIAIAGIPPLAGFFSKDEILWSAFQVGRLRPAASGASGFVAAALTAFYMFRLYWMTFGGSFRGTDGAGAPPPRVAAVHGGAAAGAGAWARSVAGFLGVPAVLGGGATGSSTSWSRPSSTPTTRSARSSRAPVPGHGVELGLMAPERR